MTSRMNRRRFLQLGAGAAALAPLLPILEGEADAAGGTSTRLVIFHCPLGTVLNQWRPTGGGANWQLSPILEPLADYKDKMIVLDGVDNLPAALSRGAGGGLPSGSNTTQNGHDGLGSVLTKRAASSQPTDTWCGNNPNVNNCSWPGGPSLGHYVASRLGGQPSLSVGVKCHPTTDRRTRVFYDTQGQPVTPAQDPQATFDLLFGALDIDPTELDRLRREGRTVVDAVHGELRSLSARMSATDRRRLDQHLTHVTELQHKIDTLGGGSCTSAPPAPASVNMNDDATIPARTDIMFEIAANALACDLTRVVNFQYTKEGAGMRASWLGHNQGIHGVSHWTNISQQQGEQLMAGYHRWQCERLAQFVQLLDQKGMLDDTLILWSHTMGNAERHSDRNIPLVLIQGDNGRMTTNRYLKFWAHDEYAAPYQNAGGESMNRVCTSICHAMGVDDIDSFGDPHFGAGPLPGLT